MYFTCKLHIAFQFMPGGHLFFIFTTVPSRYIAIMPKPSPNLPRYELKRTKIISRFSDAKLGNYEKADFGVTPFPCYCYILRSVYCVAFPTA